MVDLLEQTNMPGTVGFQADLAHTYLYLLGYNAPEHALLKSALLGRGVRNRLQEDDRRPAALDARASTSPRTTARSTAPAATTRPAATARRDDPSGKLDIVKCSGYWLEGAAERGIKHICWDGCMFPNAMLEEQKTWNTILGKMIQVRDAAGWN